MASDIPADLEEKAAIILERIAEEFGTDMAYRCLQLRHENMGARAGPSRFERLATGDGR